MLSTELEFCLNEAFQGARKKRHEFMTVEHLLLALIEVPQVGDVLRACGADIDRLRKDLADFIDETTPRLPEGVRPPRQQHLHRGNHHQRWNPELGHDGRLDHSTRQLGFGDGNRDTEPRRHPRV